MLYSRCLDETFITNISLIKKYNYLELAMHLEVIIELFHVNIWQQ